MELKRIIRAKLKAKIESLKAHAATFRKGWSVRAQKRRHRELLRGDDYERQKLISGMTNWQRTQYHRHSVRGGYTRVNPLPLSDVKYFAELKRTAA